MLTSVTLVLILAVATRGAGASPVTSTTDDDVSSGCPEIAPHRRCICWYSDVTCNDLGITDMRSVLPLPADVRKLEISRNNLRHISAHALTGAENLTSLTLREDRIIRFDITSLTDFVALQFLDLSHNELLEFDLKDVVLAKLQFLDLTGNALIHFKLNPTITNLKSIVLEDNRLTTLDNSFPITNIIERARFSGNNLGNNLKFLRNLQNVVTLWLSYNNITDVHHSTFEFNKKVQFLRLDGNSIHNLHFIKDLPEMVGLNLSSCHISRIPSSTFKSMSALQYLYLADNSISGMEFVRDISNELFSLTLSNNRIYKVDAFTFEGKNKLVRLALDSNLLVDLVFLSQLRNLERFIARNNSLSHVPFDTFKHTKTNYLDLSHNQIEIIEFLKPIENLKELYLHNNIITDIDSEKQYLSTVEKLDLSSNRLENIEFVRHMGSLRILKVSNNSIQKISENTFMDVEDLEKIEISQNNISNFDFVFYTSKIRSLKASRCSIESLDDSPLKCSRSIRVITETKNSSLSFIKSTQELWNECYGFSIQATWTSINNWDAQILIALLALTSLVLLLLIILVESLMRCRRRNTKLYDYLIESEKKLPCRL